MRCDDHKPTLSVATVGIKGQNVIPQKLREQLNIRPGDKVVLLARGDHGAMLFPMDGMRTWLDKMSGSFDELREITNVHPKDGKET